MQNAHPIIVSQDLDPQAAAVRTGVAHATVQGSTLRLALPERGAVTVLDHPFPKTPFSLRKMGGKMDAEWATLLDWLVKVSGPEPALVVDHDGPLREFVIFANKRNGLRYGIRHDRPMPAVRVIEYALLGNATVHLFPSDEIKEDFHKKYVGPYKAAYDVKELEAAFEARPVLPAPVPAAPEGGINLLVVSYFSGPCRSVGVQRINYWADEIGRISGNTVNTHVATAIEWDEPRPTVHTVPDHYAGSLLQGGLFPAWGKTFIGSDDKNSKSFNTLGHYWRYALEQYFDARDDHFDTVVISGNPFSYFDFAAYAKRRWNARVLLDYRDPFANNPRILYRDDQREHARYIERGFNFQSDMVLTVNEMCVSYFEMDPGAPSAVIENGFDERSLTGLQVRAMDPSKVNLVHAGSFYHDRSPRAIIGSLDPAAHSLHHVGGTGGIDADQLGSPALALYGRQSYIDTLGILAGGHCGVVFLSETAFETTTKIYDYLAVGLDILICTHGALHYGALADMLDGETGIYWCHNSPAGVTSFLAEYRPLSKDRKRNADRYSRRYSTSLLVDRIRELQAN